MIEKLAKENAGREATDEEFAEALELEFWIDSKAETVHNPHNTAEDRRDASNVELSLWDQLRHAYGYTARGTCNSLHAAQLEREEKDPARAWFNQK